MSAYSHVLALDLATQTGWAIAHDGVLIDVGTLDLGRDLSQGERLCKLWGWLISRLDTDLVVCEQPHLRGGGSFYLAGLAAVVILWGEVHGVAYAGVHTATLKKHATGNGRAEKPAMVAAAAKRWGIEPGSDDEADALCLLAWALEEVAS